MLLHYCMRSTDVLKIICGVFFLMYRYMYKTNGSKNRIKEYARQAL